MKKFILFLIFLGAFLTNGFAQNANRSGLFIEAGTGFLIGNPPIQKLEWIDNSMNAYFPSGPDVNLALGYRGATSSVFAWEIKIEASGVPKDMRSSFVLAAMPGIRYTTREIFGNSSLYIGFNLGFATGSSQYIIGGSFQLDENKEFKPIKENFKSLGAKLSLTAGINITSKLYAGLYFDYSIMSDQIGDTNFNYNSNNNYTEIFHYGDWNYFGSIGVRLGYRF